MPCGPDSFSASSDCSSRRMCTGRTGRQRRLAKSLTLATASPGGVYILYGEALAKILTDKLGIAVNPLPTQGPVHNVKLLETGGAQLGLTTMGVASAGLERHRRLDQGKRFRNMRALFPMYDTPFQAIVRSDPALRSWAARQNASASVRAQAPAARIFRKSEGSRNFRGNHLWIIRRYGRASFLPVDYDAFMTLTGAPVPAIQQAEAKEPLTFIRLSPEQIDTIRKAMPEFSPSKIPAGNLPPSGQGLCHLRRVQFCDRASRSSRRSRLSTGQNVFENQPTLLKAHSTARETIPQNVLKDTFLPLHPGAARYYREIDITIPDALLTAKN